MQPILEPTAPPVCAICRNEAATICCPFDRFHTAFGVVDGYVFLCAACDGALQRHHFGTLAFVFLRTRQKQHPHRQQTAGYAHDVWHLLQALHIEITSRAN